MLYYWHCPTLNNVFLLLLYLEGKGGGGGGGV